MATEVIDREVLEEDMARVSGVALREDGARDITSMVCRTDLREGTAKLVARERLVLAGVGYAEAVGQWCALPPIKWECAEGDTVPAGTTVAEVSGNLARVLRAERPLLNLLQRASGIATQTAACVELLDGTGCRLLHTRKTTPGLRLLEVTAVLAGGGVLHRLGLAQVVMVKDNHWASISASSRTLKDALDQARGEGITDLQVEVESLEQLREACRAGATRLLIDNQPPDTVREWTSLARETSSGIEVEATGGILIESLKSYAETGVDFISSGFLTHSVRSVDLGLDLTIED